MNMDNDLHHYRLEYPEEMHRLEDPIQVELVQLLVYKGLLAIPDFVTYLYDYEDTLPSKYLDRSRYFRERYSHFMNELLHRSFNEFNEINFDTNRIHHPIERSILDDIIGAYLTYDDHFEYLDLELKTTTCMLPHDIVDQSIDIVVRHLAGVGAFVAYRPEAIEMYKSKGFLGHDSTVHISSEITLYLILGFPKPLTQVRNKYEAHIDIEEIFEGIQPSRRDIDDYDSKLSDFLDFFERVYNLYGIDDFYLGNPTNKCRVVIDSFLKSICQKTTYKVQSMLTQTFLLLYQCLTEISLDGYVSIGHAIKTRGNYYGITLSKKHGDLRARA